MSKIEARCSYKIVLIKKKSVLKHNVDNKNTLENSRKVFSNFSLIGILCEIQSYGCQSGFPDEPKHSTVTLKQNRPI